VTPQRAIINIASAGSVTQMNQQQGTKFMWYTLMMLARLVLQESHRPAVNMMSLGCDATTCDHQHSQWQRVMHK
jgi:hypothetical protein